jgi:hypothetical protein
MRHNIIFLVFFVAISMGCSKDEDPVPRLTFSATIDTALPDFMAETFVVSARYKSGYSDDFGSAGVAGLIVVRVNFGEYVAYERYCPHDKSIKCIVNLDSSKFFGICGCCETQYLLTSYEQYPSRALPVEGPGKIGLKSYRTQMSGSVLRIYN